MHPFFHKPSTPLRRRAVLLISVLLVALGWRVWQHLPHHAHEFSSVSHGTLSGRPHVGDGDGLTFDGTRVRLVGIDAPELMQNCDAVAGGRHACGEEARAHLAALIDEREVSCRWSRLDRYGRLLGECRAGDLDLNSAMVRDGWAVAYGAHGAEEAEAKAAGRGIWSGSFVPPEEWRREHRRSSTWWQGWYDN